MSDPIFGSDVFSRIPLEEFSEENYKEIAATINQYYVKENDYLSESGLSTLIEEKMDRQGKSLEKQQEVQRTIRDVYHIDYEEQNEEISNEAIQSFVRKSLTREAITEAVSKGNLANEETINNLIEGLREVFTIEVDGKDKNILSLFEERERVEKLLSEMQKARYSTGYWVLDSVAEGGLSRGEVGMALAKSGGGKTSIGVNLARNYVTQGLTVLYLPLEEKLDRMVLRLEQLFSQVGKAQLFSDGGNLNKELSQKIGQVYDHMRSDKVEQPWGEMLVRKYQPQELSPAKLRTLLSDLAIRDGKEVDVVIVDYPELMNNPYLGSDNESSAFGHLYEELRAISQDYDFICWTLSQLNRTGYGQDINTAEAMEGSKRKINAVELAFTLNQNDEEFENGYLRFYLDKVRNNSGVGFSKMQHVKVEPWTMTIRDETEEEHAIHLGILGKEAKDSPEAYKSENVVGADEVQNRVSDINEKLNLA